MGAHFNTWINKVFSHILLGYPQNLRNKFARTAVYLTWQAPNGRG
jgi:hypothetical protein